MMEPHLWEQKVNWDQSPKIPFFIPGSDLRFWLLTSRDQELPESLPWPDLTFPAANPECQEVVWSIPIPLFPKKSLKETGTASQVAAPGTAAQGDGKGSPAWIWEGWELPGAPETRPHLGCAGDFLWECLME